MARKRTLESSDWMAHCLEHTTESTTEHIEIMLNFYYAKAHIMLNHSLHRSQISLNLKSRRVEESDEHTYLSVTQIFIDHKIWILLFHQPCDH